LPNRAHDRNRSNPHLARARWGLRQTQAAQAV